MLLLQRIDAYLNLAPRPACDVETAGPFTLYLNRETDLPFLSYARPTAALEGDLQPAIREVRRRFAARGRVCRWEFIQDLFPALPEALLLAAFPEPEPNPLMVVTPESFQRETLPAVETRKIEADDDLRPLIEVQRLSFGGEEGPVGESDVRFFRGFLERGWRYFATYLDGSPVAVGAHLPIGSMTEVAGIATHPGFRRKGLGGAITSAVVQDGFSQGCDCVFLTAGDAAALRLYARLGFQRVGMSVATMDALPVRHGE